MITLPKKLRKIEDEEWREVPNSNGRYWVSNYGRIKSFTYDKIEGEIRKQTPVKGFNSIKFNINKKKVAYYTHKLVAELWLEKPEDGADHVIHKDWNKKNNHYSNLQYAGKEEVAKRTAEYLKGVYANPRRPKNISRAKLTPKHVVMIKKLLNKKVPNVVISKMFLISEMQVTRIKRGENWGQIQVDENE